MQCSRVCICFLCLAYIACLCADYAVCALCVCLCAFVAVQESIRGCDVFLLQPTCPPVNDNLMELLVTIDACRRASARSITAVLPYYGYARADRKTQVCVCARVL